MPAGILALLAMLLLLLLVPLLLADAMVSALGHLGIAPAMALLLVVGIFVGSLFNIPLSRGSAGKPLLFEFRDLYGRERKAELLQANAPRIIAVNVGGCVIPASIVLYELLRLAVLDIATLGAALLAILINSAVCYRLARPVPGLGILLPALLPGCIAAVAALLLAPAHAPAVAFSAGVLGPLIGADLLHLKDLRQGGANWMSIGGAGTFDGIVISGFLAALLSA
jgi:uncharacterized membrane protein